LLAASLLVWPLAWAPAAADCDTLGAAALFAALGVTEETDCVAIIISEQEGTVALVVSGNVTDNIDGARLRLALQDLIKA